MAGDAAHVHEEMLFESRRGFVRCCRGCGAFELRFGNAILSMDATELTELTHTVAAYDDAQRSPDAAGGQHAVVWLGHSGAGFRFRRDEVSELHRLLAGANLFAELGDYRRDDPNDRDHTDDLLPDAVIRRRLTTDTDR